MPAKPKPKVSIPSTSYLYRFKLEREVVARFGNADAVARIAGQVHNESAWDTNAESAYAQGLAQFTPSTAAWLPKVCPGLGTPDPWDPEWSVRAIVCYDHWLHTQMGAAANECDRWAFTLSSYNGGQGWLGRDRALAAKDGFDAARWFGHVEKISNRAVWAFLENRRYVQNILTLFEPAYIAIGWPGKRVCA